MKRTAQPVSNQKPEPEYATCRGCGGQFTAGPVGKATGLCASCQYAAANPYNHELDAAVRGPWNNCE